MTDMPREIWAVPYEDMGHGEWDECAWEPCPFVENQKRPKYETPYIRRPVTKEEAAMVSEFVDLQDKYLHPDHRVFKTEHRQKCWQIIKKLAEAAI